LPSDEEWKILERFLGMSSIDADTAGWRFSGNVENQIKSISGWTNNGNGQNTCGFSALPSGFRNDNGGYGSLGNSVYFWTSSAFDPSSSWNRHMVFDNDGVSRYHHDNKYGFSVRCVKDE
jgi:uncharacterized protein (TIGR02145 family)